jgi:peptidyl-prolyl cis-trans isomerase B (cyclophilin B)
MIAALIALALLVAQAPAPKPPAPFATPLSLEQMKGKQAVVETSLGTFVIDLLPEAAPNHVGYFIRLAGEGAYSGTTFHRMVKYGIIQGGDPLSKDAAKRSLYGTGGLGVLNAEASGERTTRGAVAAVIVPGKPDSAGSQFFVCVVDQPNLEGKYTVFGRVVEGMSVVQKISETPVDDAGKATERVEIKSVTIRDKPAEGPDPFATATAAELGAYRATLDTTLGPIAIEFLPAKAPEHVRNFLRLASAGVYDGVAFHRVVPGFAIQTGWVPARREPLSERQQKLVRTLEPEFNDTPHVKGTVSMARGDDPASASTSFFICTAAQPGLDGKYSAFGRVVDGMKVVEAIEQVPAEGEKPRERLEVVRVRIERKP